MVSGHGLLSLPVELLHLIGEHLDPLDLLAISGVCQYLRSVFNSNSFWQRYTEGGLISQGLDGTVSLLEPKFENPCVTSLEPLCEHRFHFLKQSRLLNNLRQGKFVEHKFNWFLPESETPKPSSKRLITCSGNFLFTVDYEGDVDVIRIFDIKMSLTLLLTVNLKNYSASSCVVTGIKVVEDKLIVQRDNWIDIYDIRLPESLDILNSINLDTLTTQMIKNTMIIGKFLFVQNFTANVLHVWDLSSGNQCGDLHPKIIGPNFNILGYSQKEQLVVMSVGMFLNEPSNPHVFVYDINLRDFLPFKPVLNEKDLKF